MGISYGDYEPTERKKREVKETISKDFDITLELDREQKTIVPFGIKDFKNNEENQFVKFKLKVTGDGINSWQLDIKNQKGIIYTCYSATEELSEVVIIGKSKKGTASTDKTKSEDTSSPSFWPAGEYIICWDGFDNNEVYDSTRFNGEKLEAKITATKDGKQKNATVDFATAYSQVQWSDVKIHRNTKRIDVTLRVNLTNGGEEGMTCYNFEEKEETTISGEKNPFYGIKTTICDWDKISKEALAFYNKKPIMSRARTYEELEKITLEGINQFWSRNSKNIGKGVHVGLDNYEVYINAKTDIKGLSAPSIIYQTNKEEGRSRNFEASRKLFFYEGYLYYDDWQNLKSSHRYHINKGWYYRSKNKVDEKGISYPPLIEDYKMVSAHETGHEILLAYGGHLYSKTHKGTTTGVNMFYQKPDDNAPTIYRDGKEIDLMKYYQNYYDIPRTIISEFDLLKLIWLTKITIK